MTRTGGACALLLVVAACDASTSESRTCDHLSRLPDAPARAMMLGGDDVPTRVPAPCPQVACLRVEPDRVAVVGDQGAWIATTEQPAGRVIAAADVPGDLVARVAAAAGERAGAIAPPELPSDLRTCGTIKAGGGIGWHIIRNRGDVWQRVHWSEPPTSPEIMALSADAYPIVTAAGKLCGFGTQTQPRNWRIHHAATGRDFDATADREHAPARCTDEVGGIGIDQDQRMLVVAADGTQSHRPLDGRPRSSATVSSSEIGVAGSAQLKLPAHPLRIHLPDGTRREVPLRPEADLDGTPLARGTVRERLQSVGDGKGRIFVAERLMLPGCVGRERAFIFDVAANTFKRVVDDDVVITRAGFGLGRFFWVEATPSWVDVSGD